MPGVPIGKRQYHAFLSHAHVDGAKAAGLAAWLRDIVRAPIWYDAVNLRPGAFIEEELPAAIENSRSIILLLSKASVTRGWVQQEYRAAINHQTEHPAFRIIPVRLDDVTPPGFLQNYSYVDFSGDALGANSATELLKGLYQSATTFDTKTGRDVYVSRGWHDDDTLLAGVVCEALKGAGLQLIGDAEDQPSWIEERIDSIMASCGGYAAILPYRPMSSHKTSKYILREWELAAARGLPSLVVADPRVELPPELSHRPGLLDMVRGEVVDHDALALGADALAEDWLLPSRSPYIFLATAFDSGRTELRQLMTELIEAVTTMPCVVGDYLKADVVQREILRAVSRASFVLADISSDSPNVYVEVGAARAADVPVYLLREGPPGRPAFMLRDQQVWDFRSEAELLGRVTQIVYPSRRTLLTPDRL